MVERNPSRDRTPERNRANADPCHSCHARSASPRGSAVRTLCGHGFLASITTSTFAVVWSTFTAHELSQTTRTRAAAEKETETSARTRHSASAAAADVPPLAGGGHPGTAPGGRQRQELGLLFDAQA